MEYNTLNGKSYTFITIVGAGRRNTTNIVIGILRAKDTEEFYCTVTMTTNRYVARRMEITILILSTVIVVNLKKRKQHSTDETKWETRRITVVSHFFHRFQCEQVKHHWTKQWISRSLECGKLFWPNRFLLSTVKIPFSKKNRETHRRWLVKKTPKKKSHTASQAKLIIRSSLVSFKPR